ncbi:hypothetical protein [Eubacterium sp. 1001713B170207_170306_E7]|uniref:hypothetical protein n=1 Tax=Eubacterium sp. 1001713B170207_170306_E7 TaxID=2787097 RepID=UPI00189B219C|nr:hypothetical protein [Eubacterium sp. 1001713B170207_170306_E7]
MKNIKRICVSIFLILFLATPSLCFARESGIRENNNEQPNYIQEEFLVEAGETLTIPNPKQSRIYIGPESITFGYGTWIGGRHDYDGSRMGFEVQARYADGSTDETSRRISFMEASYGSGIERAYGYYLTNDVNRKVCDNIGIDQNKWYYFQYYNDSSKDIYLVLRSYSW